METWLGHSSAGAPPGLAPPASKHGLLLVRRYRHERFLGRRRKRQGLLRRRRRGGLKEGLNRAGRSSLLLRVRARTRGARAGRAARHVHVKGKVVAKPLELWQPSHAVPDVLGLDRAPSAQGRDLVRLLRHEGQEVLRGFGHDRSRLLRDVLDLRVKLTGALHAADRDHRLVRQKLLRVLLVCSGLHMSRRELLGDLALVPLLVIRRARLVRLFVLLRKFGPPRAERLRLLAH
mmetsp:Transcript_2765/g.6034  ORF Transcript_2765/g.6034 Transcript_2765/m.6034 type:complete len:233 (+) Transcript_2765:267-965(+)